MRIHLRTLTVIYVFFHTFEGVYDGFSREIDTSRAAWTLLHHPHVIHHAFHASVLLAFITGSVMRSRPFFFESHSNASRHKFCSRKPGKAAPCQKLKRGTFESSLPSVSKSLNAIFYLWPSLFSPCPSCLSRRIPALVLHDNGSSISSCL